MFTKKSFQVLMSYFFFMSCLILTLPTNAIRPNLTAPCKVHSPWWTSQTRAWARVTWGHLVWVGNQTIPHQHTFNYSLHTRVGNQEPKRERGMVYHKSTQRGTGKRDITSMGTPRWEGDAFASSSIADASPAYQYSWAFCAKPEP